VAVVSARIRRGAVSSTGLIAIAMIAPLGAQNPAPMFEVASIRQTTQTLMQAIESGINPTVQVLGRRVRGGPVPLLTLILTAYEIKGYQLEAPSWVMSAEGASFTLEALLPEGATSDQMPRMLQTLLVERFKLKVAEGSKELDVYAVVPKRPGAQPENTPLPPRVPEAGEPTVQIGAARLTILANEAGAIMDVTSMAGVIDYVSAQLVPNPVVDRTGWKGPFNARLELARPDIRAATIDGKVDPEALGRQKLDRMSATLDKVGLRVERTRASIPTLIVQSAERLPTGN
jgi:uncharacterized protein (TIGR03435 family)